MSTPANLGGLVQLLAGLSGTPIELALPADVGTAEWFESWTSAIEAIPARHLRIRFTLKRQRGAADVQ